MREVLRHPVSGMCNIKILVHSSLERLGFMSVIQVLNIIASDTIKALEVAEDERAHAQFKKQSQCCRAAWRTLGYPWLAQYRQGSHQGDLPTTPQKDAAVAPVNNEPMCKPAAYVRSAIP